MHNGFTSAVHGILLTMTALSATVFGQNAVIDIAPGSRFDKSGGSVKESSYHLTLLARNRVGFQNLIRLASQAFLFDHAIIDSPSLESLYDAYWQGKHAATDDGPSPSGSPRPPDGPRWPTTTLPSRSIG